MNKKNFECHITIVPNRLKTTIREIVEARGWKFSCIEGDPDLGNSTFCYATRWFDEADHAVTMVHMFKDQFIKEGLSVVRVKVEHIINDSRVVNGEWRKMQ